MDIFSNMDLNELNKQSYNQIAEQFSFSRAYVWPDLRIFKSFISSGQKVLDLGCGNGRLVDLLKALDVDYLGVDFSEKLIEQARKNYPGKRFEIMDALDLKFVAGAFDVVLCVSALNHIPRDKQQIFIEQIKRILAPGGRLLMSNWNLWNVQNKKSIWRLASFPAPIKFGSNIFSPALSGGIQRSPSTATGKLGRKQVYFTRFLSSLKRGMITNWKATGVNAPLYYYAFTKGELKRLLKKNGFVVEQSFYSKKGKKSSWLFGQNIVTVARKARSSMV